MTLMGVFLFFVQINRVGGSAIATELRETRGFGATELGLITGAMFFGSTLAQIPIGLLMDRFGTRRTLSALGMVAVLGISLFAYSESVSGLMAGRFLIGVGHGGVITGVFLLAVAWAPPDRMATISSRVIGIAGGGGGLMATAPLALGFAHFGFSTVFYSLAILSLLTAIMVFLTIQDRPPGTPPPPRAPETLKDSLAGLVTVLKNRKIWPILAIGTCFSAPFSTISALWAGPYLQDSYGLDQSGIGYILFAMMLGFNIGTIAFGPMDRIVDSRKKVVLFSVCAMIIILALMALWPSPSLWVMCVLLVLFSSLTPYYVTLAAHLRGFVPPDMAGRAITTMSVFGIGGIFSMQVGTGFLLDAATEFGATGDQGYRLVFGVVALILLLVGAIYARVEDVKPSTQRGG